MALAKEAQFLVVRGTSGMGDPVEIGTDKVHFFETEMDARRYLQLNQQELVEFFIVANVNRRRLEPEPPR